MVTLEEHIKNVFRRFDTYVAPSHPNCNPISDEKPRLDVVTDSLYGSVWKIHKTRNRKRAELARTLVDGKEWDHPEDSTFFMVGDGKLNLKTRLMMR